MFCLSKRFFEAPNVALGSWERSSCATRALSPCSGRLSSAVSLPYFLRLKTLKTCTRFSLFNLKFKIWRSKLHLQMCFQAGYAHFCALDTVILDGLTSNFFVIPQYFVVPNARICLGRSDCSIFVPSQQSKMQVNVAFSGSKSWIISESS